jgi:putative PIN family toxin of toxin-antitoxin system
MRVVLDSNILARATPGKTSAAREVLLIVTQPPHHLITSAPLLTELIRIQYPCVRALHGLDDSGIQAYLQAVQTAALVTVPVSPPPVHTRDPADDQVIATAVAGQAEVICTWDRHLHDPAVKAQCLTHGIRVLKDVELLQELRALASPSQGTP